MKPLRLTIQSFGSYGQKTEIDFEKPNQNLFLITGDTGAGKTTIFDAIVFALYGETSSSSNKKDGVVLQSHYNNFQYEPFIELTFSENKGKKTNVYTVKRVPRHLKAVTRGPSKNTYREVTGSVSLIMPDKTEYPSKEADKKLIEIVGLTKNQFMQIAMIAQGEFMELLRAKSDAKKEIFRKLFNTEIYQKIVKELEVRKKQKEKELSELQSECSALAKMVKVSGEYSSDLLINLRDSIIKGELSDLEHFVSELTTMCDKLQISVEATLQTLQNAEQQKEEKLKELSAAQNLIKFFDQLKNAEEVIQKCVDNEERIRQTEILIEQLYSAYEIKSEYQRLTDAQRVLAETEKELCLKTEQLPLLTSAEKSSDLQQKNDAEEYHNEVEHYSRTEEKVEQALQNFDKIKKMKKEIEERRKELSRVNEKWNEIKAEQTALEEKESREKHRSLMLSDAPRHYALWEKKNELFSEILQDLGKLTAAQRELDIKIRKTKEKETEYLHSKEAYQIKKNEWEKTEQIFFDNQAGILARTLVEGTPCPVCGSTEHPSPFILSYSNTEITEQTVSRLRQEAEHLRTIQEKKASDLQSYKIMMGEKQQGLQEQYKKLTEKMAANIPNYSICDDPEETKRFLDEQIPIVKKQGEQLRNDVEELKIIRQFLISVDVQKAELRQMTEDYARLSSETVAALESKKAELNSISSFSDFSSADEAKHTLKAAENERQKKEEQYQKSYNAYRKAKSAKDSIKALIQKLNTDLPKQKEVCAQRMNEYQKIMTLKELTEQQWMQLTEKYERKKADDFQKAVNDYKSKRAAAEMLREKSLQSIAGQQRPVIQQIENALKRASDQYDQANEYYHMVQNDYCTNKEQQQTISSKTELCRNIIQQHQKLTELYKLISGNVSGARMDLETYVQRYYLRKILTAANRRFQEMSAGQFELRMYSLEKAGEGKNRGLDLMVYSTVTGKEREIRTLSGGESFMAALSLALGMADRIQENSSAIHLDIMFIDEGFGSLDEHSRTQAVRVLREMAEGSKLIGIISHVSELKQEIDDQLIVRKDDKGSHVHWQIS